MPVQEPRLLIRLVTEEGRRETRFMLHVDGSERTIHVADPSGPDRGALTLPRVAWECMADLQSGARGFEAGSETAAEGRWLYVTRRLRAHAYRGEGTAVWVRLECDDERRTSYTFSAAEWNLLFGSVDAVKAVTRAVSLYHLLTLDERDASDPVSASS